MPRKTLKQALKEKPLPAKKITSPSSPSKFIKPFEKKPENLKLNSYIKKCFKVICPDLKITKKSLDVVNCILVDFMDRIAKDTSELVHFQGRQTLNPRSISTVIRILFPKLLGQGAILEGAKAMARFQAN